MGDSHRAYADAQDAIDSRNAARAIPTPDEMAARIVRTDGAAIEALTEKVLATIERSWTPTSPSVNVSLGSEPRRVVDVVIARFEKRGWHARYSSDQREGAWLAFSAVATGAPR